MQFDKIRLTGFKSFVDPTELVVEQGLTGVVGPNGCGKSNLVEALRWAMGENSPKRMRGGAMDDVIFSGTQNRTSRNLAEVVLSLDNATRQAPAAFNDGDVIEVSRRIERDSGSAYRINGKEVRQRDVQLLFADAATGAHSPSLVSQGRIGSIINAKPTERRALLEEAAGITGLHSRRHEAELRLNAADANLERLDDVMQALEGQLENIKRQARQANRYRRVAEQIRRFEAILMHLRLKAAGERIASAQAEMQQAEATVAQCTAAVAAATTLSAEAEEHLPQLRLREAEAAARLHRLQLARDGLDAEEARIVQQQEALQAQLQQVAADSERERTLASDAGKAVERLARERGELEAAREGEQGATENAGQQVLQASQVLGDEEARLEALNQRLATESARRDSLRQGIEDGGERLHRLQARHDELSAESVGLRGQLGEDESLHQARIALEEAEADTALARERHEQAEEARTALSSELDRERDALQDAERALGRLAAEEQALADLLRVDDAELWPPLIDAVTVEAGYELALGVALGDDLAHPADEAAPAHWKTYDVAGDAPVLPAGCRPLSDVVAAPAALARRLAQIGLVQNADGPPLAHALQVGQRLVSVDGGLWRWDGFTVEAGAATAAATRLAQRNRLLQVGEERAEAEASATAARQSFEAVHGQLTDATRSLGLAREERRAGEEALDQIRVQVQAAERDAAARSSRLTTLSEQLAQIDADLDDTSRRRAQAQAALGEIGDLDAARAVQAQLRQTVVDLRAALVDARAAQDEIRRDAQRRQNRLDAIAAEIRDWQGRAQGAEQQIEALARRRGDLDNALARLAAMPAEIAEQRARLLDEIEEADRARAAASEALATGEREAQSRARALRADEQALGEAREARVRIEAALEQAQERLSEWIKRVREELDCAPEEVLRAGGIEDEKRELPPAEEAETKLERLKRERERMGPVNLRAEQEAQELSLQLETMASERADLEAAIARLRQGIASLNREGRERLLAAFKQADEHFRDLFVRLFGGGKAHLALTESDDPLEAGLEIMASPPGKRLQILSLLSGGEQALTALALLFAVFLTNPAPICVLDEVDAPLDDTNVERFCNLVAEIGRLTGTRFLIITHHPYTMARMDRLYGVTMSERGVSQLMSVDLSRAERMRAAG